MDQQVISVEWDPDKPVQLGMVVVPNQDPLVGGLQIKEIQPGSRIDTNGHFHKGDIIVKVNEFNLAEIPYNRAQKILKEQLQYSHQKNMPIELCILRLRENSNSHNHKEQEPQNETSIKTKMVDVKHRIRLIKSPEGLGFKIAARDVRSRARCPIMITTINPRGAAIEDGRLAPGDTLLGVNGIDLVGKSQDEVTSTLLSIGTNETADILISRLEEREIHLLDIPLNGTRSAGLAIRIKGPKLDNRADLGIYVDKIITGGAAWKDGRLQPGDQITAINGISLIGLTMAKAKETLTMAAVQGKGPDANPNVMRLSVLRRKRNLDEGSQSEVAKPRTANQPNIFSGARAFYPMECSSKSEQNISNKSNGISDNVITDLNQNKYEWSASPSLQSLDDDPNESIVAERFQRDGFGRQSMSEKRHAQLNAKITDTYRRSRSVRLGKDVQEARSLFPSTCPLKLDPPSNSPGNTVGPRESLAEVKDRGTGVQAHKVTDQVISSNSSGNKKSLFRFFRLGSRKEKKKKQQHQYQPQSQTSLSNHKPEQTPNLRDSLGALGPKLKGLKYVDTPTDSDTNILDKKIEHYLNGSEDIGQEGWDEQHHIFSVQHQKIGLHQHQQHIYLDQNHYGGLQQQPPLQQMNLIHGYPGTLQPSRNFAINHPHIMSNHHSNQEKFVQPELMIEQPHVASQLRPNYQESKPRLNNQSENIDTVGNQQQQFTKQKINGTTATITTWVC